MCFATPEEKAAVAALLGKAADATDADVTAALLAEYKATQPAIDAVTRRAEAAEAEVTALSAALRDKESEVLSLSAAAPKAPDAVTLSMYADNVAAKREAAVAAGAVSEAQAKGLDALLADAGGNPTALALSAAGPARKPLAFAVWDWVKSLSAGTDGAVRVGNAVPRAAGTAPPPQYADLSLSGAGGRERQMSAEELQARVDANLAQTELGRRALAARRQRETAGAGK